MIEKYFSDFNELQLQQFAALKDLYTNWNEKINVISRKDMDNFYEHHVLHSLVIATHFEFTKGMQVMDLGSGGGFPGIPLAIFFPDTQFHLVDSINKKLKVVAEISDAIGLKNITTQHSRIEEIKTRKFDFVISRAVAPLKDLWRWSRPLLKSRKSGVRSQEPNPPSSNTLLQTSDSGLLFSPGLICLKGGDLAAEIQESGVGPKMMEINSIFREEFFKEKYLLYITR